MFSLDALLLAKRALSFSFIGTLDIFLSKATWLAKMLFNSTKVSSLAHPQVAVIIPLYLRFNP